MFPRTLAVLLLTAGLTGSAVSHAQTVADPGFEAPAQGQGKFAYRATGSAWSFAGSSGLAGNASGFTAANPAAPEGQQVALLQNTATVSQAIPAWPAGSYQLRFQAAQRNYPQDGSHQVVSVLLDGQPIATIKPAGTTYRTYYTPAFAVPAGDHTLAFQAAAVTGSDNAAFVDAVGIAPAGSQPTPAAVKDAWIGTSGKVFGVRLQAGDGTGIPIPYQSLAAPLVYRNGQALGPLGPAADLANNEVILYPLAPGDQVGSGDVVTVSAPSGWLVTTSGLTSPLTGAAVDNRTGRSPLPPAALTAPVLRPGVNCNLGPTASWGNYWPLKNWAYKVGWPPGNLGRINGSGSLPVYSNAGYNGVDATGYPGPAGLWLVYYHPTGPIPPLFALSTADRAGTAVMERTDLANLSAPGGYVGRVYDFEHVPDATTANIDVQLSFTAPPGSFDDLWIVGPGDFDAAPGAPVTLDTSDPLSLSRTFAYWTEGTGSLRWVDSSNCGGNPASCPYPELLLRATDKNWGDLGFRSIRYGFTSIGPVDTTATPWMYSAKFPSFPATLGQDITTAPAVGTVETWTFSDAATAPLMAGLELRLDSEVCRILSVSDTSVRLYRGSNGTTPATHTAGPVQVSGRKPLAIPASGIVPGGFTYQLATDRPHGLMTGHGFTTIGTFPPIAWSDGETTGRPDARYPLVTGPDTLVSWIGPTKTATGAKPSRALALDPTKCYSEMRYGSYIPPEVTAMVTAKLPGAAYHVNINMDASDDMAWTLLRLAHDLMPPGRSVICEYMNEPWNWAFTGFGYATMSAQFLGQSNPYTLSYYCQRAGEIGAIGRAVFADRPGDFKVILNCQLGSDQAKGHLAYAAKNGWPIDRIAIAPYLNIDTAGAAFSSWDDDQLCDLWIHFLWNSRATGGMAFNAYAAQVQGYIGAYNAATGGNCKLMAYEGGIELAAPSLPRSLDLVYNPNWYWMEDTFYRWLDRWQFSEAHVYSLSQYHSPQAWGMYHWPRQKPGYGDGRGGGSNNRLRLARPGQPNTKPPGVNVDLNDSVRGQAFRDRLRKAG